MKRVDFKQDGTVEFSTVSGTGYNFTQFVIRFDPQSEKKKLFATRNGQRVGGVWADSEGFVTVAAGFDETETVTLEFNGRDLGTWLCSPKAKPYRVKLKKKRLDDLKPSNR